MLTTIVLAGALLATPQAGDKWDIKAALAPKASVTWDLSTAVNQSGQDHNATMKMGVSIMDGDKDKPLKATYSWTELTLDGGQAIPDQSWDVTLDAMGGVTDSSASDGADTIRVMLMPLTFVYPDKPVGVGDTWTDTIKGGTDKDDHTMTCAMTAGSMDKVGDADALKVTEKISQKGDQALTGTGTWWVDKTGKVLKFEVKVSNWLVPMAGEQPMDATFTGSLSK